MAAGRQKKKGRPGSALVVRRAEARGGRNALDFQQLGLVWTQLRGDWSWLVVVPSEPDISTAEITHALSQIGSRLSARPIDFIEAVDLDLDKSSWLIGRLGTAVGPRETWGQPSGGGHPGTDWTRPTTKTLVSLESPLANPLALPVALAADGVVLCVRRGRSRLASIRSTVEALGADRVLCCVLIE